METAMEVMLLKERIHASNSWVERDTALNEMEVQREARLRVPSNATKVLFATISLHPARHVMPRSGWLA